MKPEKTTQSGLTEGCDGQRQDSFLEPKWVGRTHLGLDLAFVFLGSWTLFCWILVLLEGSFNLLIQLSWFPVMMTALFVMMPNRDKLLIKQPPLEKVSAKFLIAASLPPLVIVALYVWSGSYVAFWSLSVVFLFVAQYVSTRTNSEVVIGKLQRESWVALVTLCALAVFITLSAHRSDDDDSFYISLIVTALDRPYEALMSHDGMFGEPGLNLFNPWYQMKTFEPLVAAVSQLTSVDHLTLYYLVFPFFTATFAVIATWSALRVVGGPMAMIGTAVVIIVIAAWGDVHTSIGNHGFVRLYQSKAVMLTVCVPAAVFYAARFSLSPNQRNWLLLCFCQVAALGVSGSAIFAVPTTAMALLAGWYISGRRSTAGLWGVGILVIVGVFFAIFMADSRSSLGAVSLELDQWLKGTRHGLGKSLGTGPREAIAFFALLLAPLIAPKATQRSLICYVLVLLILIANPLLPGLIGQLSERGTWRLFWSVPFPLMLGLLGQRIAALNVGKSGLVGCALLMLLLVSYISVPGKWTLSSENRPNGCHPGICGPWYIGVPKLKVPVYHELGGAIVRLTQQQDLILAPYIISMWMTTYRHHPRLVRVRWFYGQPLRTLPITEQKARVELGLMVSDSTKWPFERVLKAAETIPQLGIDVVVIPAELHAPGLPQNLIRLGCVNQTSEDQDLAMLHRAGYQLWRCTSGD